MNEAGDRQYNGPFRFAVPGAVLCAVFAAIGPAVAGALAGATGSYAYGFIMAAAVSLAGGFLLRFVRTGRRKERQR